MRKLPKLHVQPRILRRFRSSQRQVEDLGTQAGEHIEQHLVKRFGSLAGVRRFMVGWIGLVHVADRGRWWPRTWRLNGYYQTRQSRAGRYI